MKGSTLPAKGSADRAARLRVLIVEDEALIRWAVAEAFLRLPDSSDLSLLTALRRDTATTAVVMMTAHGTDEDAVNAKALGAFEVVEKPFDVHQIERVVVAAYRARTASG